MNNKFYALLQEGPQNITMEGEKSNKQPSAANSLMGRQKPTPTITNQLS